MTRKGKRKRVLSIYPSHRGYSFAVLEGQHKLIDWGSIRVRHHKNSKTLMHIRSQIDAFEITALVIEDRESDDCRRGMRVKRLLNAIEVLGQEIGISVYAYSRSDVRTVFEMFGANNKEEIASSIYTNGPSDVLPKPAVRKPWMSEPRSMSIYDAISFGITHFYLIK